jgi:hypothetical protein
MERTPFPARLARAAGFVLAAVALAACGNHEETVAAAPPVEIAQPTPSPAPPPEVAVPVAAVSLDGTPCADLAAIKDPPTMIGKPVDDPAYTALKAQADAAVPCLLDAMVVAEPLDSPQKIPGHTEDFTVGDLAFFLLVDFGVVDFAQALPPDVSQATLTRGPFAYFDWIVQPGNRERLQARVRGQVAARERPPRVATRG